MFSSVVSRRRAAALAIAFAAVTLAASAASAQTPLPASASGVTVQAGALGTPAFAHRVKGKQVWITTTDGNRRRGVIKTLSPTALVIAGNEIAELDPNRKVITTRGADMELAFDRIVRIEEVSHRIRNGIVLGIVAGTGVGFLVDASYDCFGGPDCAAIFWGYTGLGAGIGGAVGALMNLDRDRDVLYDRGRRSMTMSLAPILSPNRKGITFTMAWR